MAIFQDNKIGFTLTVYDRETGEELDIDPEIYWQAFYDEFAYPMVCRRERESVARLHGNLDP